MKKRAGMFMQRIRTFFYCFRQGIRSIFHNGMFSLATIGTISASLFLLGLFFFVTTNVSHVIETAEQNVGITVLFDETAEEEQIRWIGEEIKKRTEVSEVIFISAQEAWENYKKDHLNAELAATFGEDNPLEHSASYRVMLRDVEGQPVLVRYIESLSGVRKVNAMESVAETLGGLNRVVALVSIVIIAVLVAVAMFLIHTTVSMGISVRKEEIAIMNLIGATDFFVRFPFIVEGMLLGFLGALLPVGILHLIYARVVFYLTSEFESVFHSMSFLSEKQEFSFLTPLLVAIGVLIGWLGSSVTSSRQLKKIELH